MCDVADFFMYIRCTGICMSRWPLFGHCCTHASCCADIGAVWKNRDHSEHFKPGVCA